MCGKNKLRGGSSKSTKLTDNSLLASQTSDEMAELNAGEEMVTTIHTEVKALQAEIMADFHVTTLTMREEIVKELCSMMTLLQVTVSDHANKQNCHPGSLTE